MKVLPQIGVRVYCLSGLMVRKKGKLDLSLDCGKFYSATFLCTLRVLQPRVIHEDLTDYLLSMILKQWSFVFQI